MDVLENTAAGEMQKVDFFVREDGKIDIQSGKIKIMGIFPYENGMPVVFQAVEKEWDSVRYHTIKGEISLSVRECQNGVVLSTILDGFDGAHDIEPVGEAVIAGADHVYVQGFGMEGPSGYYPIDGTEHFSHGIATLSDGKSAMAVYSDDHRRFRTVFAVRKKTMLFSDEKIFTAGIDLEETASGRTILPDLYFIAGRQICDCLSCAAKQIADAMGARKIMPPAYHWCSWYYYYENFSQELLEEFLQEAGKDFTGFRYIQIDAGYTPHIGDWLNTNHRYPDGLRKAAASIKDAGYNAGVWIAPFLVGDLSELYLAHPDWIVRDGEGKPYIVFRSYTEPKIFANRDSNYFILDATHPDAFDYLKNVFETLNDYGFSLFKTDFMLWGMVDSSKVKRYDNSLTSVEIMRKVLAMIREVIGEDGFLLGSIAPFMPFLGYADAMRIAGDMGAQWSDKYGPLNLLQELPFDNYFNHIFWQNDPDSIIIRDFETSLTEAETKSLLLLQVLSGGVVTTSDPVGRLPENRKKWLQFLKPEDRVYAEFPYLTKGTGEIVIIHRLEKWNLLFVMNPTEYPIEVLLDLGELFGDKNLYQYRYDWDDEGGIVSEKSNFFTDRLMPHESVLLFITEEPLCEKPSNLWNRA